MPVFQERVVEHNDPRQWAPPVVQRREERSEHSTFEQKAEKNPDPQYFAALRDTCGILDAEIFPEPQRRGLVVITGATASGKSKIARGLIYLRMMAAIRDPDREPRKPHLITFEDPIEKFWVSNNDDAQPLNFDYTPREKNIDASDLRSVLKDALRQTPTLIFVGEIRDRREWATVVEFASTGHSLIATAHAGSLAEAWGKILGAVGTSSPSQRSDIADRTLGIVHLRPFPSTGFKGSVPALWRYTSSGAKSMMAEGRASLVPLRSESLEGYSSLGRVWLLKKYGGEHLELQKAAFQSDLEGL